MSILRDTVLRRKLEADLFDLGYDLVDYYRKKISARKLVIIALELPYSSRLKKELGRRELGDQVDWDTEDYLLAAIANNTAAVHYAVQGLLWQNGDGKGEQPKPPEPIHPPGYQPEEPEMATTDEIVEWLAQFN